MAKNLKSETIVVLSFISIFALTTLLSYVVTHIDFIKSFDLFFYKQISSIPRNYILDFLIYPINKNFLPLGPSNFPIFLLFIIGIFLVFIYFKRPKLFFTAIITIFVGGIFVSLQYLFNSEFIFRNRPFLSNNPLY